MDHSPAAGTSIVSVELLLKHLTQSGLMSAADVRAIATQAPATQPSDCRPLLQELVQQGKLTKYQAQMLYQGKTKGLVLGNHVVLDKIGQGGMGMVFMAKHQQIGRVVALKVLPPAFANKPTAVKRFQREVQAVAKLQHPNIVTAYDAGEDNGVLFLVMEYVDGIDLARKVKQQGPLAVPKAVDCILQAARGLAHAHAAGIIHRDVKPHNLLLAPAGASGTDTIKVLDMGLARIEGGNVAGSATSELTETGNIMGTCDYMSPEQALNTKHADQRSDIYSLGCTLYYLLSGRAMYAGETAMEKLMGHQTKPIPPLPNAPPPLQAIYQRMVAKQPEDRYATMDAVIADLESVWLTSRGRQGPDQGHGESAIATAGTAPSGRRAGSSRRLILAGAVGGIMLVGCLLAGLFIESSGSPQSQPSQTTAKVDAWMNQVRALPPEQQAQAVAARLQALNPNFDGQMKRTIENGKVTRLFINTDNITDISPIRAMPHLAILYCTGSSVNSRPQGILADLSPLQGMRLKSLYVFRNPIADLSPLRGMPLEMLNIHGTGITDISALAGMPLKNLVATGVKMRIKDLSPLKDMPLVHLKLEGIDKLTKEELLPLRGLPLQTINGKPAAEVLQ